MQAPGAKARRAGPAAYWEVRPATAPCDDLLEQWRELAARSPQPLCSCPAWMMSTLEALPPSRSGPRAELHLLRRQERLMAVLPLQRSGWPLHVWRTVRGGPCPACGPALDEQSAWVPGAIVRHLLARSDALVLERLHPDGALAQQLVGSALELGLGVQIRPEPAEAFLALDRPWRELREHLPSRLVERSKVQARELQRGDRLRLQVRSGHARLGGPLAECLEVETEAWHSRDAQAERVARERLLFCRRLAECAAAGSGELVLYMLRLQRRMVAFDCCVRGPSRIDPVWCSRDPSLEASGVGDLIRLAVLEHEASRGFRGRVYLAGGALANQPWSPRLEPFCRVEVLGRSLMARAVRTRWRVERSLQAERLRGQAADSPLAPLLARARRWWARGLGTGR